MHRILNVKYFVAFQFSINKFLSILLNNNKRKARNSSQALRFYVDVVGCFVFFSLAGTLIVSFFETLILDSFRETHLNIKERKSGKLKRRLAF